MKKLIFSRMGLTANRVVKASTLILAIGMRAKGFTLIELLVVMLIIGIASGVAILAFGDFGASRQAKVTAENMIAYLHFVQEHAILQMSTLGVNVEASGYSTYRLTDHNWLPLTSHRVFRFHPFPNTLLVRLHSPIQGKAKQPDIVMNASGDMTPFTLTFTLRHQTSPAVTIVGESNGHLTIR